ncbi:hypothetical protein BKA70DRAFT_1307480 [Coprinopsis sp. MPI-PUGE-AT-0042]|nr:hypothetical protein BKA70DRAFT_1307480 [Coprinopsis sp. MPI-PUGE-AT-0042]
MPSGKTTGFKISLLTFGLFGTAMSILQIWLAYRGSKRKTIICQLSNMGATSSSFLSRFLQYCNRLSYPGRLAQK